MQWHSHFAAKSDLDVLWWSDHSEVFDLSEPMSIDYRRSAPKRISQSARRQAGHAAGSDESLVLELVGAPPEDLDWAGRQAEKIPGRMNLVARSRPEVGSFSEVVYSVRGPRGAPRGFLLPRPVSSGAVLAVDLRAWGAGGDTRAEIEVGLSWHHRQQPSKHVLRYLLTAESLPETRKATGDNTVTVTVPVGHDRRRIVLDLQRDAALLEDGEDNTITSLEIRLAARRGARASLEIFGLELSSSSPEPDHQLAQIRRFASGYGAEYDHAQHVGVEFLAETGQAVHLNAFLPGEALTGPLASGDETTWNAPSAFVHRVQALGGMVSLNHMFGTTAAKAKPAWQATLARRKTLELLRNRAFGADILEVGYVGRGGVGLEYHLRTWDALTARGLLLYGNGVSDTHGSPWGPTMLPNRFATWIWSEGVEPEQLIHAMRHGRMVFGDPFAYPGAFYFRVGKSAMGDRVPVRKKPQRLRIGVDGFFDPDRHRLYLVHALIRPGSDRVLYLSAVQDADYRREIGLDGEIALDVSKPCFVRLELFDRDGSPLLFTNPIVFDRRNRLSG